MRRRHIVQGTGAGLAGMLLLTACGGGGSSGTYGASGNTPAAAPAQSSAPAAPAMPSGAAGAWTRLAVSDDSALGKIVVDGKGWTLYRFDGDTAKPPVSHCAAACARLWPPAPWTGRVQAAGFGPAVFGKIKRPDGSWQLTLDGWPLYRYAKDGAPGDTAGQGVGGKWFAATPQGKKAKAASGGGSSGYGY